MKKISIIAIVAAVVILVVLVYPSNEKSAIDLEVAIVGEGENDSFDAWMAGEEDVITRDNLEIISYNGVEHGIVPSPWAPDKSTPFNVLFRLDGNIINPYLTRYYMNPDFELDPIFSQKNLGELDRKKANVIDFIWKGKGLPNSFPDLIEKNVIDSYYENYSNLKKIDKLVIDIGYGVNSVAYFFHPIDDGNGNLMIYYAGHDSNGFKGPDGSKSVQFFLDKGFSVLAFSSPLAGLNSKPFEKHDDFKDLDTDSFSSMKFFMDPVYISLNYLENEYEFNKIYMMGKSGGGWATVLYSAIDDRIDASYPVAGSLPLIYPSERDYEQKNSYFYGFVVDYFDLYALGSIGRKQAQIFNLFDPCCFQGIFYDTFPYESHINSVLEGEGKFMVYVDETSSEHSVSEKVLEFILGDIEGSPSPRRKYVPKEKGLVIRWGDI